jgi:hypothetical protein
VFVSTWDLWLDYHRRDSDGLTHGNLRNARSELELPGQYVVVGTEEAVAAVAEVVRVDDGGVVRMRVLPGSADDNRSLLQTWPTPR